MRITRLETLRLRCPVDPNHTRPSSRFVHDGSIHLRIHTDAGVTGLGEPSPYGGPLPRVADILEREIQPLLVGKAPTELVASLTRLKDYPEGFGHGNVPYDAAWAGVEQALWDIEGKVRGLPLYRLLNPALTSTPRLRVYASGGMSYEHEPPELIVEEAALCQAQGYTAWKMRPSVPGEATRSQHNRTSPPIDMRRLLAMVEGVRRAVGDDMDLLVDTGCRCRDIQEATDLARALEELGFCLFEEPLPRVIDDYARLAEAVKIPISSGESLVSSRQVAPWLKQRALDVVQPDGNLAGITGVLEIARLAEANGIPCVLHNWANPISLAANLHLAAAIPNCSLVEYPILYNPLRTELVQDPRHPLNGYLEIPDRPGLGVELDEQAVRRYSV